MTFSQYLRLLLVCTLPLLALGYFWAIRQAREVNFVVFCDFSVLGRCISDVVDRDGHHTVNPHYPRANTGFWVQYDDFGLYAAPLMVRGHVRLVSAAYWGMPPSAEVMNRYAGWVGREEFFALERLPGAEYNHPNTCSEVRWTDRPGIYGIVCEVERHMHVRFDVELRADIAQYMERLRASAEREYAKNVNDLRTARIMRTLSPLGLFLLASLVAWLVLISTRFVRTGSWRVR